MPKDPIFLTEDLVIKMHHRLIDQYGGAFGVLDPGLLDSALHAPQASWGGEFLHRSLADMAAAYWHGFAKNHSFMDGNKRVAATSASVFLRMNGWKLTLAPKAVEEITIQITENEITRETLAQIISTNVEALNPEGCSGLYPLIDSSSDDVD